MGCHHAAVQHIKEIVADYKDLVSIFPRLIKGDTQEIKSAYKSLSDKYFADYQIVSKEYMLKTLLQEKYFQKFSDLEIGLAYLFSEQLHGKRHVGGKDIILELASNKNVKVFLPNGLLEAPIMIKNQANNRSVVVSATKGDFNNQMINSKIEVTGLSVKLL